MNNSMHRALQNICKEIEEKSEETEQRKMQRTHKQTHPTTPTALYILHQPQQLRNMYMYYIYIL
jgi:hypothetical protein